MASIYDPFPFDLTGRRVRVAFLSLPNSRPGDPWWASMMRIPEEFRATDEDGSVRIVEITGTGTIVHQSWTPYCAGQVALTYHIQLDEGFLDLRDWDWMPIIKMNGEWQQNSPPSNPLTDRMCTTNGGERRAAYLVNGDGAETPLPVESRPYTYENKCDDAQATYGPLTERRI